MTWTRQQRHKARMDELAMAAFFRPSRNVIGLAHQIRMQLGSGGANFPGARELYNAAEKIEAWAGAYEKRNPVDPEYVGD